MPQLIWLIPKTDKRRATSTPLTKCWQLSDPLDLAELMKLVKNPPSSICRIEGLTAYHLIDGKLIAAQSSPNETMNVVGS